MKKKFLIKRGGAIYTMFQFTGYTNKMKITFIDVFKGNI